MGAARSDGRPLRRFDYDADAAAETFRSCAPGYPGLAAFIEQDVLAVPSDAEALAVFSGWAKADDDGMPRAE